MQVTARIDVKGRIGSLKEEMTKTVQTLPLLMETESMMGLATKDLIAVMAEGSTLKSRILPKSNLRHLRSRFNQ
jgi:hypothetical protein